MRSRLELRKQLASESLGDVSRETLKVTNTLEDARIRDVLTDIAWHNHSTRIIATVGRMVLDPNIELSFSTSYRPAVDKRGLFYPAIRSLATPELRNQGDVKVRAMYRLGLRDEGGPNNLEVTDLDIVEFVSRSKTEHHPIPLTPYGEVDVITLDGFPEHVKDRMAALAIRVVGGLEAELGTEVVPEVIHN